MLSKFKDERDYRFNLVTINSIKFGRTLDILPDDFDYKSMWPDFTTKLTECNLNI